jgi:hypothetical protein
MDTPQTTAPAPSTPAAPIAAAPEPVTAPVTTAPPAQISKPKTNFLLPVLLVTIIGVALVAFGGYYYGTQKTAPPAYVATSSATPVPTTTPVSATASPAVAATSNVPADWKTYTDTTYGFSVKVPPSLHQVENTKTIAMIFANAQNHPVLSIEQFKGADATSNYNLSCSYESTSAGSPKIVPAPLSPAPFGGNITTFRKNEDHACWMVGDSLFLNVYSRDELNAGKPGISDAQFVQILSTFTFTN